jgi:putative ABC transport system permease protein
MDEITQLSRERRKLHETQSDYFYIRDMTAVSEVASNTARSLSILLGAIASISLVVGGIGIMNIMLVTVSERTREIGIRKIMGASSSNIVHLLSKDFLLLVIIAFFMASPLAWFVMHNWLKDFAYRIDINWWIFILAGISAGIIAITTVSFQAFRAALSNPVKSLRTE